MANVMFKRGVQANLPTGNSIVDGVFYLTTDTGRLYVGQDNDGTKALVELNKSITLITAVKPASNGKVGAYEVQTADGAYRAVKSGEFYYHASSNLLMIGNDDGSLTQVNPDTDIHVGSGTVVFQTPLNDDIQLNTKLYNTNADGSTQTTTAIVDQSVKFHGGQNVTLSATDDTLTINAASSVLSAAAATSPASGVNLSVDSQATPVNVIGDGGTTVTMDNGKIKISSVGANGVTYDLSGYNDLLTVPSGEAGLRQITLSNADNSHSSSIYLPIP